MVMRHETSTAPSRVEQKRVARTEGILDEAMKILAAEGIDALTLGRLAKALDYVPAALYRYFDSKDALLAALQRRAVGEIHAGLRDAQATVEESLRRSPPEVAALAALLTSARYYLELPRTNPNAYFLVAVLMGDPRPLLSDEESRRTAPLLVGLLTDVQTMFGVAADARALARGDDVMRTLAFWALLQGTLSLEKARRIAPALPTGVEVGAAAVAALLVGWGATPSVVKRAEQLAEKSTGKRRS